MKRLLFLSVISFLIFSPGKTFAQQRQSAARDSIYWEQVLSAYSDFCTMTDNARKGDKTAQDQMRSQADKITNLLKAPQGSMTASQQARFAALRQKYSGLHIPDLTAAAKPSASQGSNKVIRDTVTYEKTTIYRDSVKIYNTVERVIEVVPTYVQQADETPAEPAAPPVTPSATASSFFAMAQISPIPDFTGGLMLGFVEKVGGYIKYTGNFTSVKTDYDCSSDGTTKYGKIWTTGSQKIASFRASAGICVRATPWLIPYAGVGYGERTLAWEDSALSWVRVSDRSFKGIVAEAGIIFKLSRFAISAGVSTISFGYCSLDIGAGFCF